MKRSADVVIIGAGVIGCSAAYHLVQAGISDVVVLERGQVGGGSSGKSAAMLTLQFCRDALTVEMAKYSYERYACFEDELGVSTDFRRTGWMYVATEESAAELRRQAHFLQGLDVTTEILDAGEVARRYPELNTDDVVLGTWGPDDGPFDPHMIMWGYMKGARQGGASLYEGVTVQDVLVEEGRVSGVRTEQGTIRAGVVVNAAGPWAAEVGRWAGVEVPLQNSARTIVVTADRCGIPQDRPFVEDLTAEWYFRPAVDGVLMGMGASPVPDADDVWLHEEQLQRIIEVAVHRVPALEQATLRTAWTGVRPLTADGHPIVGFAPGVGGFLLNCGWGGMGLIMAPLAGQLTADLIVDGASETMDVGRLGVDRFYRDAKVH